MKIFLLEDDLLLNEIIEEHLHSKEHNVMTAFNGDEAEELIYAHTFDLLLLDVNVPGINGFELLQELRQKEIKTPAIFITSKDMIEDIEKGFAVGCDDYLKKPFELKELDLRINNIKRLFKIEANAAHCDFVIDKHNLMITRDESSFHITQKELEVLHYLMKSENVPVGIEELSLNVWSYEESPTAATIRTYIKNLRKILGDDRITNIRGVGYRFNA